jgi:hypothetical protein
MKLRKLGAPILLSMARDRTFRPHHGLRGYADPYRY